MNITYGLNVTETNDIENKTISLTEITDDGDDSLGFIFVPLGVLIGIMVLSALVYLMARNQRKLVNICKSVQLPRSSQNYDWDNEDNDDPTECLLSGKLQIDNQFDKYQSGSSTERSELYT